MRAICCDVPHLGEQAAREFHAVAEDGFRSLCARNDLDAVLVLSADLYGHLPIFAACESGKAVYTAAALDIHNPAEAVSVRERVEASGVSFMAEFPRRLAPATVRLKELIATRLGQPRLLFCHRRSTVPAAPTPHRPRRNRPTILREMMEEVDWCRYVVAKEPQSVVGIRHLYDPNDGSEDYQMMSLAFAADGNAGAGPVAQISCGRYLPAHWPEAIAFRPPAALQVCCERGVAFVDLPNTVTWFDDAGRHMESLEDERPIGERLLMQFYRGVTSLLRKSSDLDDACRALDIVLAAQQSFVEGKRLAVAPHG